MVWASEASYASEWAWRSLRKSSKPSMVWYILKSCIFRCESKVLCVLKFEQIMGPPKKKFQNVGLFSVNHAKSTFYKRIPFNEKVAFHKENLFSQICSNGYMRVKRVPLASKSSKPKMVFASDWAWRSLRKSSKLRKSIMVLASEASFRSFATKAQFSQTRQSKANQAIHANKAKPMSKGSSWARATEACSARLGPCEQASEPSAVCPN